MFALRLKTKQFLLVCTDKLVRFFCSLVFNRLKNQGEARSKIGRAVSCFMRIRSSFRIVIELFHFQHIKSVYN